MKNIIKTYKIWNQQIDVLKWIDLEIKDGEFVSIMGPSGSGKSTLMNIIWMLDTSEWEYSLGWVRVDNLGEAKRTSIRSEKIWFIFQNYSLIPRKTALKQVMLPLMYQGISSSKRKKIATEALEKVGLSDKMHNKPNELSWWQQQRVSIARAMAIKPDIILADEPTGALDTGTWVEIMKLLEELNKDWTTIILITHEKEISAFAKRNISIRDGLII